MNEMTNGARLMAVARRDRQAPGPVGAAGTRERGGLVVDLSGTRYLDQADLALLLTAQQLAAQDDRDTWLAGIALPLWHSLQAMGLGRFFRSLPATGGIRA
jgi:anti-anti-sigma regulatory factor